MPPTLYLTENSRVTICPCGLPTVNYQRWQLIRLVTKGSDPQLDITEE